VWLYLLIIVLLLFAIGVQVLYLRTYAGQAGAATKVVILANVVLLVGVLGTVIWFAVKAGGS